jgi:hypothetical protein
MLSTARPRTIFSGVGALHRLNRRQDAWGQTQWGRAAVREVGTMRGAILLVAGLGFLALGIFFKVLAG